MPFLGTVADVATAATFLLGSAPEALAWLRNTFRGTGLQEPAEAAAFVLQNLVVYQELFTDAEMFEILGMYTDLKKGIMEGLRAEQAQATKPANERESRPRNDRISRVFKRAFLRFFTTTKPAELLNQPSEAMVTLLKAAAKARSRTTDLSEKAQFRAVVLARKARIGNDGSVSTLFGPDCPFTASKISLLFQEQSSLPVLHPTAIAPTQLSASAVAPAQPLAEIAGHNPFATPQDDDMDTEAAYYQLDDLRPSSPSTIATIASTCASTEEPMPTAG